MKSIKKGLWDWVTELESTQSSFWTGVLDDFDVVLPLGFPFPPNAPFRIVVRLQFALIALSRSR